MLFIQRTLMTKRVKISNFVWLWWITKAYFLSTGTVLQSLVSTQLNKTLKFPTFKRDRTIVLHMKCKKKQIQKEIWHDDICELGSATSQTNQPSCNIKLHLKLCKMSMSWKGGLLKEILRKLRLVHNEKRWTSDEIMTSQ